MKNLLPILFFFIVCNSYSQISEDHYKSAVSFMYDNYNNKTAFNLFTNVHWFEDGSGLWFESHSKDGKQYKTVEFKKGKVALLFDHKLLAEHLEELSEKKIDANDLQISKIEKVKGGLEFNIKQDTYTVDLDTYQISLNEKEEEKSTSPFEKKSPDGKWIAYTENYNLFIKSTETEEVFQLSTAGKKGFEYASWYGWDDIMEGENGERPKRFYVNWSKDSKWISSSIVDTRKAEKMYLLDHSIDSLYKPKLLSYYRGSPGDTTMVELSPVFYNIETKSEVATHLPKATHINSVSSEWTGKSGQLIASITKRGYLQQTVHMLDLNTGTSSLLIEESSDTGIDNFEHRVFEDFILFLSERSGWRQLYLYNFKTKETKRLTSDGYYINTIQYVDEKNELVYFSASGKDGEMNPYHQQLFKVNFKGKETLLTPEEQHHSIDFSKDGKFFVDQMSTIQSPLKMVLRNTKDGRIVAQLTEADISAVIAKGYKVPEVFDLIGKDGKTRIYGAFWKPTHFDATKTYPIIDATYTGPHTQRFPTSFRSVFSEQSLAELGFIVVRIDGLGTAGRSKAFQDHSYKNMENNLEDHVLAIKHLAKKHAFIDVNKVGVYGHSAGGYDTGRAMLGFPEFYKVGVASSADHDFRMEKAWWPEMYQGWPVDETYEMVSNITNAANLKGKLLLTHGGIDENVNPSATFKLAEALIKADKNFDLLILPSQRHGYRGDARKYFIKKRWNYFVAHLLGATPIWDFKWK